MPTTLEGFLKTAQLGPVTIGMAPFEALTVLGDPERQSAKKNPLVLKYGALELTFWKHSGQPRSQLMEIDLKFQPTFEGIPQDIAFTDFAVSEKTSFHDFRQFVQTVGNLPVHTHSTNKGTYLVFLSGVLASFSGGTLERLNASQKKTKESTPQPLSDEREPSNEQIMDILAEARRVAEGGAFRAGFVLAWAALEAILRRMALRLGLQGRVGVQPSILIRELFSASAFSESDVSFLEEARQVRTSIVHGLVSPSLTNEVVWRMIDGTTRLLEDEEKHGVFSWKPL